MNHTKNDQNRTMIYRLTGTAVIAALYVVLTVLAAGFGLASGAIQVRFSEALTILPYFTPAAIPGLTIGCLISNIVTGCLPTDVVFGTLATLIGTVGTRLLRGARPRILCTLPPVIANTVIVPLVLKYAYGLSDALPFLALTVGIGEIISCTLLGSLLISAIAPVRRLLFSPADH